MGKKIIPALLLCFMMTGHIFGAASARANQSSETGIFQDLWCRFKYGKSADQIQQELFYLCYLNFKHANPSTNHADELETLLQNGGQQFINCRAREYHFHNHYFHRGCTLLMCAIGSGQREIAKILLRYGADVSIRPGTGVSHVYHDGATALILALNGRPNQVLVRLLLEHGADPNQILFEDPYGLEKQTSPFLISCKKYFERKNSEYEPVIDLLLEYGADRAPLIRYVNKIKPGIDGRLKTELMRTVLETWPHEEREKKVKALLRWGAFPNAVTRAGNTALHLCAKNTTWNRQDLIEPTKLLLQHGARTDIKNNDGNTPLHLAAANNNFKIVELLLEHLKPKQDPQASAEIVDEQS